jgi:hypothetical protein
MKFSSQLAIQQPERHRAGTEILWLILLNTY